MPTIRELREDVAKLVTQARSYVDEITDKTDETRAQELNDQADKALEEARKIDAQIERLQKIEELEGRVAAAEELQRRSEVPSGGVADSRAQNDGEITYRQAFYDYLRAGGNLGQMKPESRAVLHAGYQDVENPKEERAQTTSDAAGGYTVPTELQNILIRSMLAWGPMYDENVATVLTTSGGGEITMPTVNDTAVTAGAHTEGATLTDDGGKDATFGEKALNGFEFDTEWVRVSKALADDSIFAMETLLGSLLGERLGRIANLQLTTGTGTGAPHGIVTASAAGVAAAATALDGDDLIDLFHSVDPAYRGSPKQAYMMNDATLAFVRKLKDGQGNYLWQMGNVQAGIPQTLNGSRIVINQAMAGIGANNRSVLFGDFGKYYVRKVGAPLVAAIQDKDFWPGFGVAGYIRFDGEIADAAAIKRITHAAS